MLVPRVVATLIAGVTLLMVIVMLTALDPGSRLPGFLRPELATGLNRRAQDALERRPADLASAAADSRAALAQSPYDTGAELRLAYLDWLEDGVLNSQGVQSLATSYERVAYDRTVAFWRIQFALENWDVLPASVRRRAQAEVFVLASEPGHRWPLRTRFRQVRNPQGRVVSSLWSIRIARTMAR